MPTPKNIAIKVTFELKPRVKLTTASPESQAEAVQIMAQRWAAHVFDTFPEAAADSFDILDPEVNLIIQL